MINPPPWEVTSTRRYHSLSYRAVVVSFNRAAASVEQFWSRTSFRMTEKYRPY